jgi:hypothetical protein
MNDSFISIAANNAALEEAALKADAEADKLQALADEMALQIAKAPRRGLKWRFEALKNSQDEFLAGARAARRIAIDIRALKISEEER